MNTLGKTLVVLNLLFALVTGGFVVFTWATRFRYDQALEKQRDEAKILKAFAAAANETLAVENAKYKKAVEERDALKTKLDDYAVETKVKLAEKDEDLRKKTEELDEKKTTLRLKEEEVVRRNAEVKNLTAALQEREGRINGLEADARKFQASALAEKARADSLQARAENLLAANKDLLLKIAELNTGGDKKGPLTKIKLGEPNPPPTLVKGTIERVESDLVTLSVGSDHGLALNQTVEAYRLAPDAAYLGRVRIVEVDHHSAVGRLERSSISRVVPLRAGDMVISELKYR
jgi:hypothetical protein